jgi:hypothetical protein
MPLKVDGRVIGLVLLRSTIVTLKQMQKKTNRNMISPFVANIIYGLIVDNLALEHKMIIRHIQCTLLVHYKIHKGLYDKGKGVRDEIRHIWDLI